MLSLTATSSSTIISREQEECKNSSSSNKKINGINYCYLTGTFPTITNTSEEKMSASSGIKATAVASMDPSVLKITDLNEIIKSKRLASFSIQDDVIKVMYVHPDWIKEIKEEGALELIYKSQGEFTLLNDKVSLKPLTEKSYSNMANIFKNAVGKLFSE